MSDKEAPNDRELSDIQDVNIGRDNQNN